MSIVQHAPPKAKPARLKPRMVNRTETPTTVSLMAPSSPILVVASWMHLPAGADVDDPAAWRPELEIAPVVAIESQVADGSVSRTLLVIDEESGELLAVGDCFGFAEAREVVIDPSPVELAATVERVKRSAVALFQAKGGVERQVERKLASLLKGGGSR